MITVAEIENDIKNVAAKFDQVDKTALGWLDAAMGNTEIAPAIEALGKLAGVNVPPGIITSILAPIKGLLAAYQPQQAADATGQQQVISQPAAS
jgi:hypothetical protein